MPTKILQKGEHWQPPPVYEGDVVIPDETECTIIGVGGPWGTQIRGSLTVGQSRVTIDGITVYDEIRWVSGYQSQIRDLWTRSLRIGYPDTARDKWPSNLYLSGVHVYGLASVWGADEDGSLEIHAGDITWVGGSVERIGTDPVIDRGDDYGQVSLRGVRFEHDDTRVLDLGPGAHLAYSTCVLTDVDIRRGGSVEDLEMVQCEVIKNRGQWWMPWRN